MISPDKDCHLCDLCRKRTNLVLPTGDLGSPVVLVGEAIAPPRPLPSGRVYDCCELFLVFFLISLSKPL